MLSRLAVAFSALLCVAGYGSVDLAASSKHQAALVQRALLLTNEQLTGFDNSLNIDGRLNDTHYVFDAAYTDRECDTLKAGAIFSTETCRHNLFDFICKRDQVVQNVYNPLLDRGCRSSPLISHTFDNGCRRGVSWNDNDFHFRFRCGLPDSALILVPDCGDVYGFTYASFLPTHTCLGRVSWECDGKGNTLARIFQEDGCKGASIVSQLARAGQCVEGFSLFCHDRE